MNRVGVLSVFAAVISVSTAQVITLGKSCKSVNTVNPFDVKQYLGNWYEISKFNLTFEDGQKCVEANYQLKDNGHVRVDNKGYLANNQLKEAIGEGFIPDENQPGRLKVRFSDLSPYADYWILKTDYDSYSLVYSCTNVIIGKVEFAWVLSRNRTLDQSVFKMLYQEIAGYDVDTSKFTVENQSNFPN